MIIRILKFFTKGLLAFLVLMLLYFLAAIIGSVIPVNKDQPQVGEVTIYLRTNGVHTDYIFPVESGVVNWQQIIPPRDIPSKREDWRFIAFGWGDLDFYQNTPEWDDLTFPTAMQAVFLPTPSAMHIEYMPAIRLFDPTIKVEISRAQYESLVNYVLNSFDRDPTGAVVQVEDLHYNQNDAFYHANRSLHFFYTCNTWVNNGLKEAGLRACLWTPFDEGIFYQYR